MSHRFVRPEAAIQTAIDLLSIGKKADALDALYEVVKEIRKRTWSQKYEDLIMKFMDVCVDHRNTALTKEGLFQYRALTQKAEKLDSLKTLVEYLLSITERKIEEAQKTSLETHETNDFDEFGSFLSNVISSSDAQERSDRTVLGQCIRFHNEILRNCLDALRNNRFVEDLYCWVAEKAFEFCLKYQRCNEFQKLCDLLRNHLGQVQKSQATGEKYSIETAIKLDNPKTLERLQKTRLQQVDTALKLNFWQESYKSAIDLHGILQLSSDIDSDTIKPEIYAEYYDKLSLIFWQCGSFLFHSAALLQKFLICKELPEQQLDDQATRLFLATISIPYGADSLTTLAKALDLEEQHTENLDTLSSLLFLSETPTRDSLLDEFTSLEVLQLVAEPVRKIYSLTMDDFSPLCVIPKVNIELKQLESLGYEQYFENLKEVVAIEILKQLSFVYESLSLDHLQKIIGYFGPLEFEQFIVEVCRKKFVMAKLDYVDKCIKFNHLDYSFVPEIEDGLLFNVDCDDFEYTRLFLHRLHDQLEQVNVALNDKLIADYNPDELKTTIDSYYSNKNAETKLLAECMKPIETYYEMREEERQERIKHHYDEVARREEQRKSDEARRLDELADEDRLKREKAIEEKKRRIERADRLAKLQGQKMYAELLEKFGEDKLLEMNDDEFSFEQRVLIDDERREAYTKMRQQEIKFDYFVRGLFSEEILYYKEISDKFHKDAEERHVEKQKKRVERAIANRKLALKTFEDLSLVADQAKEFFDTRVKLYAEDLVKRIAKWKKQLETEKVKRLADRKIKRKLDRQQKAEYERRKLEEEEKEAAKKKKLEELAEERRKYGEMQQRIRKKQRDEDESRFRQTRQETRRRDDAYKPPIGAEKVSQGQVAPWRFGNTVPRVQTSTQKQQPAAASVSTTQQRTSSKFMPDWRAGNVVPGKSGVSVQPKKDEPPKTNVYVPPSKRQAADTTSFNKESQEQAKPIETSIKKATSDETPKEDKSKSGLYVPRHRRNG